jgi:hypothetical protein
MISLRALVGKTSDAVLPRNVAGFAIAAAILRLEA